MSNETFTKASVSKNKVVICFANLMIQMGCMFENKNLYVCGDMNLCLILKYLYDGNMTIQLFIKSLF